jgi:hypothetical protein
MEDMPMAHIVVDRKRVVTGDFVQGLLHCSYVDMTLEERIHYHPKELLDMMIHKGVWHRHRDICSQCIDRLIVLDKNSDVAQICKFLFTNAQLMM